jgi:hypothetical protein
MLKALTVRQPYANCLCDGTKPVENRSWATSHRGLIAIHAGLQVFEDEVEHVCQMLRVRALDLDVFEYGAIIGVVELRHVVEEHSSPWYARGQKAWVVRKARLLKSPVQCRGAQRLWTVPPEAEAAVRRQL